MSTPSNEHGIVFLQVMSWDEWRPDQNLAFEQNQTNLPKNTDVMPTFLVPDASLFTFTSRHLQNVERTLV